MCVKLLISEAVCNSCFNNVTIELCFVMSRLISVETSYISSGSTHWWPPQTAGRSWRGTAAPAARGKTFWGLRWRRGCPPTDCGPGPGPPLQGGPEQNRYGSGHNVSWCCLRSLWLHFNVKIGSLSLILFNLYILLADS